MTACPSQTQERAALPRSKVRAGCEEADTGAAWGDGCVPEDDALLALYTGHCVWRLSFSLDRCSRSPMGRGEESHESRPTAGTVGAGVAATLSTREALPARACLPIPVATRRPVPTSERARVEGSLGSSACMLPFSIFPVGASSAARLTYPKKCTLMWVSWPPCCASLTSAAQAPPKPTRQHRMLSNSTPMGQLFDRGLHLRLFDPSVGFRLIPVLRRRATNFHFISPQSSARQQRGN